MVATDPTPAPRRRRRAGGWVSKSDVTSFLRCPYAFWQIDSGAVAAADAIDALGERLIEEGVMFEQSITAGVPPRPPELNLPDAFRSDTRIYDLPRLRNDSLGLRGIPDAVDPSEGALIPVEVKSHRDVRRTDELELAFYWRLLDPYRTGDPGEPRGRLILRRDGTPAETEVRLTPERFSELDSVIAQVRDARRHGVKPRVCGCTLCSGPLREHIATQTWAGRDLTLIWGIARQIATHLEALGINDFNALDSHLPEDVAASLCSRRVAVAAHQVRGWMEHARSYREGRAVMFGPPPKVGGSFIALDLEYDASVWLTAVLICDSGTMEHNYFWGNSRPQEREALMALEAICATYPELPIVTWAGISADLPKLRDACRRHRLDHIYHEVNARHIDLFQHATRTMRIPDPELSLKAVADYFGVPRISEISDGLEAQFLYECYRSSRDPGERARLQANLLVYNRDDLEATAAMAKIMRAGPETWPGVRPNRWDEDRAQQTMPPRRLPRSSLTSRATVRHGRRVLPTGRGAPVRSSDESLGRPF
jgi:predicted RecB family nuclease